MGAPLVDVLHERLDVLVPDARAVDHQELPLLVPGQPEQLLPDQLGRGDGGGTAFTELVEDELVVDVVLPVAQHRQF